MDQDLNADLSPSLPEGSPQRPLPSRDAYANQPSSSQPPNLGGLPDSFQPPLNPQPLPPQHGPGLTPGQLWSQSVRQSQQQRDEGPTADAGPAEPVPSTPSRPPEAPFQASDPSPAQTRPAMPAPHPHIAPSSNHAPSNTAAPATVETESHGHQISPPVSSHGPDTGALAPSSGAGEESLPTVTEVAEVEPASLARSETRDREPALPVTSPIASGDMQKGAISIADEHPELFHSSPLIVAPGKPKSGLEKDAGIWLSGSGSDILENCTKAEQRKHGALGLTVLVPATFALIASAYAVSTLTSNPLVIVPIALIWAGIILLIDRSILATYRSSLQRKWKVAQFAIRMGVATLMGLTISHPITLLLFKDTITTQIELERDREIAEVREVAAQDKAAVEAKIETARNALESQRAEYKDSFQASFLSEENPGASSPLDNGQLNDLDRTQLENRITTESAELVAQLGQLDTAKKKLLAEQENLTEEIAHWQAEYEAEINGERSGRPGLGPRARSIENDQLKWRRQEAERLTMELTKNSTTRFEIEGEIQRIADTARNEFATLAIQRAQQESAERQRLAGLRKQAQESQLTSFVANQDGVRSQIQAEIDSGLADLHRLREEVALIANAEQERIAEIQESPRRDLLSQTLALHHLFGSGTEGGKFALLAYLVLAGLFLAVDTIPILIKFTSKGGEYDEKLDQSHYEAALAMLERRKQHMELLHRETLQKLEGTQGIFEQEAALLRTRLDLIDRQIEVARKEATFRQEFGFAQRLPRAS